MSSVRRKAMTGSEMSAGLLTGVLASSAAHRLLAGDLHGAVLWCFLCVGTGMVWWTIRDRYEA